MTPTLPTLDVRLRRPLDRFELDLEFRAERQVTALFGASGCGKTTALRAVAGLDTQVEGRVALGTDTWLDSDAVPPLRLPPEQRGIGYVPQDGLLFPHLDVRRNLLSGARRARDRGLDPAAQLATVCALLELEPLLQRGIGTLSGGERQRVALGRALCSGPRLLLLDEPLASVDRPLRRRLLPLIQRVRHELSIPMLWVSHDPDEVRELCDEVVCLERGKRVDQGSPEVVLDA